MHLKKGKKRKVCIPVTNKTMSGFLIPSIFYATKTIKLKRIILYIASPEVVLHVSANAVSPVTSQYMWPLVKEQCKLFRASNLIQKSTEFSDTYPYSIF